MSSIRIMIATTLLSMGVNVLDVKRVIIWKIPITKSLANVWQRIGQGGWRKDCTSIGYIFLPYWVFNTEGGDMLGRKPLPPKAKALTWAPWRNRNSLPAKHTRS